MKYEIPISEEKYTLAALNVMNCFLKLTKHELNIVRVMVDRNVSSIDLGSRALIRAETGKSVFMTNNYIKRLKDKGILVNNNGKLSINQNIMGALKDQEISVRFNVNKV